MAEMGLNPNQLALPDGPIAWIVKPEFIFLKIE